MERWREGMKGEKRGKKRILFCGGDIHFKSPQVVDKLDILCIE